jgi:hypothetical protein
VVRRWTLSGGIGIPSGWKSWPSAWINCARSANRGVRGEGAEAEAEEEEEEEVVVVVVFVAMVVVDG